MRWLSILVMLLAVPTVALAKPKPKVAIAPLDNDADDRAGAVVAEVAATHAKVTSIAKTRHAIDELGVSVDERKGRKKLRVKLEVEVVIHGRIDHDGGKRTLALELNGPGKSKATIELPYKTAKLLHASLAKVLSKKIEEVDQVAEPEDDADEDETKPVATTDDDKPHKLDADDDRPKHASSDDDRPKHASSDDDKPKKHVAAAGDDDDDTTSIHKAGKHHKHHEGVVEEPRDVETAGWLDVAAGLELARRTLTWKVNGTEPAPPWVGTADPTGTIGGEIYPFAQSSPSGAGGIGLYGGFAKVVGVSIAVPNTTMKSSIDSGQYEVGVRYRVVFGTSSVAFGAGYWKRYYNADRSSLMTATALDMPDVDYGAVAPNVVYRVAFSHELAGFAEVEVPFVLSNGGIGAGTSYGRGTAIAYNGQAGIQYLVGDHYAIDVAAGYDQVGITFQAATGSQAADRGVTGSSDKSYGATAAFAVLY